jgi:hypothetical protein
LSDVPGPSQRDPARPAAGEQWIAVAEAKAYVVANLAVARREAVDRLDALAAETAGAAQRGVQLEQLTEAQRRVNSLFSAAIVARSLNLLAAADIPLLAIRGGGDPGVLDRINRILEAAARAVAELSREAIREAERRLREADRGRER